MIFLRLQNDRLLRLQSGGFLILRGNNPRCPALLAQDGSFILLEDGDFFLLEGPCGCVPSPPIADALLLQDGFFLRLQDCGHLLLGDVIPPTPPPADQQKGYANPTRRQPYSNEAMEEEDLELIIGLWLNLR